MNDCKNYGEPNNWISILEKHKDLYLCFAHFGGLGLCQKGDSWADEIISILKSKKYKNVYTDLSCFIQNGRFAKAQNIIRANPDIADKILYGSDFDMLPLFYNSNITSLASYITTFRNMFNNSILLNGKNKNLFDMLTIENPWRFMFER